MVQWRDVGYVADSDDEDIDLDSEESQVDDGATAVVNDEGRGGKDGDIQGADKAAQDGGDAVATGDEDKSKDDRDLNNDHEIDPVKEDTTADSRQEDDIDELQLPGLEGDTLQALGAQDSSQKSSRAVENDIFDVPSSPLSDAPSDLSDDTHQQFAEATSIRPDFDHPPYQQTHSAAHIPIDIRPLAVPLDNETSISGRIFRRRNPIQLHPYILEQEQYKQSLKARGLRPVAIASSPHRQDDESQEQESQNIQGGGAAEDSQDRDFRGSSPAHSSPAHEPMLLDLPDEQPAYDSDELPDLPRLIGDATILTERRGPKRRKVLQTYSRNAANHTYPQLPIARTDTSVENRIQPSLSGDVFDLPDSADDNVPVEPATIRRKRNKKFRAPRGLEPIQLPTPESSSQTPRARVSRMPLFPELSESESDSMPHQPYQRLRTSATPASVQPHDVVSVSSEATSESSASESEQLRKVSHRLRGVLPASWLRLDQHAQGRRQRAPTAESPARTQQRGVAQYRSRSHTMTPHSAKVSLATVLELSDDSVSPSKPVKHSLQKASRSAFDMMRDQSSLNAPDSQDIIEDDFVDPMLPTTTRQRRPGGKKRQSKLTNAFERISSTSGGKDKHASSGPSSGPSRKRARKQTKQRTQYQQLSILDSRSLPPTAQQPDFLRIATRHARSRTDKARHSPRRKIIQLQDRRNDTEVREVLESWRDGRLKSKESTGTSNHHTLTRAPLLERTGNQQRLPRETRQRSDTLRKLLSKPRHQRTSTDTTTLRQSTLDDLAPRPSATSLSDGKRDSLSNVAGDTLPSIALAGSGMPGQLEEVRRERPGTTHRSAFRGELQMLNRLSVLHSRNYQQPNIMLERFLQDDVMPIEQGQAAMPRQFQETPAPITRRQRKHTPQRLNIEEADIDHFESFSAPPSNKALSDIVPSSKSAPVRPRVRTIEGLGPFGTYYTTDFDIKHLPVGTYFEASTFIGSGELCRALNVSARDLDEPSLRRTPFQLAQRTVHLSAWTEEASDYLTEAITTAVQKDREDSAPNVSTDHVTKVLRQTISYVSTSLYFLDSIDRSSCIRAMTTKLKQFIADVGWDSDVLEQGPDVRGITYMTVLLGQLYLLLTPAVVADVRKELEPLMLQLVTACARKLFRDGLVQVWSLHSRSNSSSSVDTSPALADPKAECVVIYFHLLKKLQISGLSFTHFLDMGLSGRGLSSCHLVSVFDRTWHDIFAIVPLMDFGEDGIISRSSNGTASTLDALTCICAMLRNLFELYRNHLCDMSRPINPYIRATLSRCFVLIRRWGWRRCENTLGTMFDLFAQNSFSLLRNEEGNDSPRFLRELDKDNLPCLDVGDRSFDIFLKALYVGLHSMRSIFPNKKIRNIAWRFIPNHGRQYDKSSELKPADLQALRNTHDLLTVLHAASPVGFRPTLDLVRNLVNFSSSHSEVCKLNIRTWANLARFWLSGDEATTSDESFSMWYNDLISQLLCQYRQARSEAQAQADDSGLKGFAISKSLLESTVASNQKQTVNVIVTALAALGDVLEHATIDSRALDFFQKLALPEVLSLIESGDSKVHPMLICALEVYEVMYKRRAHPKSSTSTITLGHQESNEDSQDFGDFPDIDDLEDVTLVGNDTQSAEEWIFQPVHRLLSNCFGTESCVDDKLLTKVVDVWVRACDLLIRRGERSWSYFLDAQSSGSWNQLRDTESKRKYFPYFVRSILDLAPEVLLTDCAAIFSAWLTTIVERQSVLKFQHLLTAALLDANSDSPLVANLPFVKDTTTSTYRITLTELGQRRLATISTVLANMRSSLESALLRGSNDLQRLRHDYQYLLRQLMTTMKKNYQELEQASTARGAYVDFVQKVVEDLQQYTSDICPIDRFFTDSAAFPLPASDPTYVVGRLKSYGLKSNDIGEQKKLAIFFQAVCERAAVDNQQPYLIEQLVKSVEGTREGGSTSKATLRTLLVRGVFPAFLESAFHGDCGWILAVPILEALSRMISDLWYAFSLSDKQGVEAVLNMLTDALLSLRTACRDIVDDPELLKKPYLLATMAVAFNAVQTCAPLVDYVHRSSQLADVAVEGLSFFQHFSHFCTARLHDPDLIDDDGDNDDMKTVAHGAQQDQAFYDIRKFCKEELTRTLTTSWHKDGDDYFVVRGNGRRQVLLDVGDYDEERMGLLQAIKIFEDTMAALPAFSEHGGWAKPVEMRFRDDVLI